MSQQFLYFSFPRCSSQIVNQIHLIWSFLYFSFDFIGHLYCEFYSQYVIGQILVRFYLMFYDTWQVPCCYTKNLGLNLVVSLVVGCEFIPIAQFFNVLLWFFFPFKIFVIECVWDILLQIQNVLGFSNFYNQCIMYLCKIVREDISLMSSTRCLLFCRQMLLRRLLLRQYNGYSLWLDYFLRYWHRQVRSQFSVLQMLEWLYSCMMIILVSQWDHIFFLIPR